MPIVDPHALQNPAYRLTDVNLKGARRNPAGCPPSFQSPDDRRCLFAVCGGLL